MELARQLKVKREECGLSQDEVAKAIFVSRQTVSNWENDKTYPDVQSLLLLSKLFGVSIDELIKGDAVAMQQAIKEDSRKMRLLSYGMIGFSVLAFLFLLMFSLVWQEPSGFARMSKGNIAGAATFIVLYAIGFGMAIAIDRLKKKHDIVTYREIDRFLKGELEDEPDSQGFARRHPALGMMVKLLGGAVIGLMLAGLLLVLEGLRSGQCDLFIANNAMGYTYSTSMDDIKVAGAPADVTGDYPCCRQNCSDDAYHNKFQSLVDFEVALIRGYDYYLNNKEDVIKRMVDYSAQTPEYVEAALYGTDSYRNMMDLSPDPHTNEIVDYYKAMLSIGEIEGDENAMDQYATSEVYKRALDRLVSQYPDNQTYQKLAADFAIYNG